MSGLLSYVSPLFIQAGTTVYVQAWHGGLGASQPGGVQLTLTGPSAETHVITTFSSWSDTQVSFVWPAFTNSGSWSLAFTAVITSNTINFLNVGTDPIAITSVSPTPVVPGGTLTINGTGFGATQGTHYIQLDITSGLLGPLLCAVTSWSATQIQVTIPSNAVGGFPPGQIQSVGIWTPGSFLFPPTDHASASIFVESNPSLTLTSPAGGFAAPSQSAFVVGHGFGFTQGSSTVSFHTVGGVPSPVVPVLWATIDPGQTDAGQQIIEFVVPALADLGADSLVITNGAFSITIPLSIQSPLALPGGTAGTRNQPVTLTGSGFGASFGTLTYVSAGGNPTTAAPTDWANTLIRTNVPATADFQTGYFYVFLPSATRESAIFTGFKIGTQASGPATSPFPTGNPVTSFRTDGTYPIPAGTRFPRGVVQGTAPGVNTFSVAWLNANDNEYTLINTPGSDMVALGGLANHTQTVIGAYPPVVIGA